MKQLKKAIYLSILPLLVVGGLVFANRETKAKDKLSPKPLPVAEKKCAMDPRKAWEATPDGIRYKAWEDSPEGKKIYASVDRIKKQINTYSNMEAVVTSVTFKRDGKSADIKWLIVRINGGDYMMQFTPKDFQQLSSLKVNDKIMLRSRYAGFSPNHPYLIVSGDSIAHNNKLLFKREFKNKGC